MTSDAKTPIEYIEKLPEDRKEVISELRKIILENLPTGFCEVMNYGMIGYVIPHEIYPDGYHCNPKLPLPFMNIASQKKHIAVYHLGIYSKKELLYWFVQEYGKTKQSKTKLDMGKGCIRFRKSDQIPISLIGKLAAKMSPQEWINVYESKIKK